MILTFHFDNYNYITCTTIILLLVCILTMTANWIKFDPDGMGVWEGRFLVERGRVWEDWCASVKCDPSKGSLKYGMS